MRRASRDVFLSRPADSARRCGHAPSYAERKLWGIERAMRLIRETRLGDAVIFYATRTGVLGYGVVKDKYYD